MALSFRHAAILKADSRRATLGVISALFAVQCEIALGFFIYRFYRRSFLFGLFPFDIFTNRYPLGLGITRMCSTGYQKNHYCNDPKSHYISSGTSIMVRYKAGCVPNWDMPKFMAVPRVSTVLDRKIVAKTPHYAWLNKDRDKPKNPCISRVPETVVNGTHRIGLVKQHNSSDLRNLFSKGFLVHRQSCGF
jgi:hypothetical protein